MNNISGINAVQKPCGFSHKGDWCDSDGGMGRIWRGTSHLISLSGETKLKLITKMKDSSSKMVVQVHSNKSRTRWTQSVKMRMYRELGLSKSEIICGFSQIKNWRNRNCGINFSSWEICWTFLNTMMDYDDRNFQEISSQACIMLQIVLFLTKMNLFLNSSASLSEPAGQQWQGPQGQRQKGRIETPQQPRDDRNTNSNTISPNRMFFDWICMRFGFTSDEDTLKPNKGIHTIGKK